MSLTDTTWQPLRKYSFRFFFLFLGLSSYLCLDALTYMLHNSLSHSQFDIGSMYQPIRGALAWLDKHIFHLGYNPGKQQGWPGDNHFGVLIYIPVFFVSVVGAIVWGALDRK